MGSNSITLIDPYAGRERECSSLSLALWVYSNTSMLPYPSATNSRMLLASAWVLVIWLDSSRVSMTTPRSALMMLIHPSTEAE